MSRKRFADEAEITLVREVFICLPLNTTISTAELVERTGLDLRVVRDAIAQIIQTGIPIVPNRSDGGYLVTTDIDLLIPEVLRLESHASNIRLRADGLREAAKKLGAELNA